MIQTLFSTAPPEREDSPFYNLRVRSLLGWTLVGQLVILIVLGLFFKPIPKELVHLTAYLLAASWLVVKFATWKIDYERLFGPLPKNLREWSYVTTVFPLVGFSVGMLLLTSNLALLLPPELLKLALDRASASLPGANLAGQIARIGIFVIVAPIVEEAIFRGVIL